MVRFEARPGPPRMFSSNLFSLNLPDEWLGQIAVTFVRRGPGAETVSINVSAERLDIPVTAEQYAAAQEHALQHNLQAYAPKGMFSVAVEGRRVPVREYSWSQGGNQIFQCQAYFVEPGRAWTLTFTSGGERYAELRQEIPHLLAGFRAAAKGS